MGTVFAVVSAIIAYVFRDNFTVLAIAGSACVVFAGLAFVAPALLRPLNLVWFRFSLLLHRIVNPIILGLMFVLAIVPFGIAMRIWRDPMRRQRTKGETYWIPREPKSRDTHSMTNQF